MGYWDRHGFPDFYSGSANGGVAPLDSNGANANIRSMWATKAGFDGRPADQPGHIDDYWTNFGDTGAGFESYESTDADPYVIQGRQEHQPDCLGDFIGLSQKKWTNMDGECDGNINAFSFNFWDKAGGKRVNFNPPSQNGEPIRDIQSGLRHWTEFKSNQADTFSQLADFNPETPIGSGFTFEDLKAEIDAGYPVLLFLQPPGEFSRALSGMGKANPEMHGMLAYGYYISDDGGQYVRFKNSWGSSGDFSLVPWTSDLWFPELNLGLRGVIGYHPKPKITAITRADGQVRLTWNGPSSKLHDYISGEDIPVNWFSVEVSDFITGPFTQVAEPSTELESSVAESVSHARFYRIRAMTPSEAGHPR